MARTGDAQQPLNPPLTSAPSRPAVHTAREGVLDLQPFTLEFGGQLERACLAWRLSEGDRPIVLALGGISAGRYVYTEKVAAAEALPPAIQRNTQQDTQQGWWAQIVGPGRMLDTAAYRILGIDYLGGSGQSTGPRGKSSFPSISAYDQAEALRQLADHLRIRKFHAIVGASYGGMVGLAFAERFPDRVRRIVSISAADRAHPMATAWRSVQRAIVRNAVQRGQGPEGLKLARALAMATYRTPAEFMQRFGGEPVRLGETFQFPVESYLYARGDAYAQSYVPEAFVCLSESIDLHRVTPERIDTPTTLIAVQEDQLVPLADIRALAAKLAGPVDLHEISSLYGHDAFLKEVDQLRPIFASALK